MRIIFMGTPEFAVASLKALIDSGQNVVAVVTAPDKPAGRGQKLQESAVKKFAVQKGIPVLQPTRLRDLNFLEQLRDLHADLQVVVAFRMLPEAVWNMPPLGTINVHASLLPQYRGAAPINHAILNGDRQSGVTTFLLQHDIDTGNILLSKQVDIADTDTAGDLHDKLMEAGATTLLDTIKALQDNKLNPIPQDTLVESTLRHAPKIFKNDCEIDWNNSTDKLYNQIRGLSPYPGAFTSLDGKVLKIYLAAKENTTPDIPAGTFKSDAKTYLKFATADGYLQVLNLQIEGKKKMDIEEFLRGYRI